MNHSLRLVRDRVNWRLVLAALVAAFMVFAAACAPPEEEEEEEATAYEIWALDQSTNLVHIYEPVPGDGNTSFASVDVIDLTEHEVVRAHMISFTADYAYAVIASTASGDVTIIRTADREVVDVIATGPGTHMASPTPDGSAILVDVIGSDEVAGQLVEIEADWENEEFAIDRTLVLADDPLLADNEAFPGTSPVCHDYTADGDFAYVTLGPGLPGGGLVVLDLAEFELVAAFPPADVAVNCGALLLPDGNMLVNGGGDDVGHFYVFDTENHALLEGPIDSLGEDAHGVWLTPDGELWMVNRSTGNAVVIDLDSYDVEEVLTDVGGTPDIIAVAPDGDFLFVSLRGPTPLTGAPHLATGDTPGFAVIDLANRELYDVIQPEEDADASDFHGIGVRVIGD